MILKFIYDSDFSIIDEATVTLDISLFMGRTVTIESLK